MDTIVTPSAQEDKPAGHTPGPWEWRETTEHGLTMRTLSPGVLVLDNHPGCGGPWGDSLDRANARLIAAAPDLLEALQKVVAENGWRGGPDDALLPADEQPFPIDEAMHAISKALPLVSE